jgi:hypothetical protein
LVPRGRDKEGIKKDRSGGNRRQAILLSYSSKAPGGKTVVTGW